MNSFLHAVFLDGSMHHARIMCIMTVYQMRCAAFPFQHPIALQPDFPSFSRSHEFGHVNTPTSRTNSRERVSCIMRGMIAAVQFIIANRWEQSRLSLQHKAYHSIVERKKHRVFAMLIARAIEKEFENAFHIQHSTGKN